MSENTIFHHSNILGRSQNKSTNAQQRKSELKSSSKRSATSPTKGSTQKRSALGNITNVDRKAEIKKEYGTKRMSLRLQLKVTSNHSTLAENLEDDTSSNLSEEKLSFRSTQKGNASSTNDAIASFEFLERSLEPLYFHYEVSPRRKCLNYEDIDTTNTDNIHECPQYAFTTFEYMRVREKNFIIMPGYLAISQTTITAEMRAILVDWMVEVQENFELNHETLYLAVKLVDHYLQKVNVVRERLQLVGATSLLIAAKFDERHAPYVDDFLYVCDDAYAKQDMLAMERSILILLDFNINIPISYRFLRRYAKCSHSSMEVLTLARFVLELSLQTYSFVDRSASMMAAAALWLAIKMKDFDGKWGDTLFYFTSYTEKKIFRLACELNGMVNESKGKKLKTIWQKYSHSIFYEVAITPTLTSELLQSESARLQLGDDLAESEASEDFLKL